MSMDIDIIKTVFAAMQARDISAVLACFAEDALFLDPHYPYPEMQGKVNIRAGLEWAMRGIRQFDFQIVNTYQTGDEKHIAIEFRCRHTLHTGKQLDFMQVFLADSRNGKIQALRAFLPFRPNGFVGTMLAINHFFYRLSHKPMPGQDEN